MMRRLVPIGALLALLVVAGIDPSTTSWLPICPVWATTGLYCAGCGATRAIHALLHGDARAALAFNPLLVLAMPVLLPFVANEIRRVATGRTWFDVRVPRWAGFSILAVLLAFGLMRNVPGFELLGPPR